MRNFKLILSVFLLALVIAGCSHTVKITKKVKDDKSDYYTVATDVFYAKPYSNEIPFEIYFQYSYEKDRLGDKFVFAVKFVNYGITPRISTVKLSVDGYEQNCKMDRFPVVQREGVRGVSETVYFRVPREMIEEMIATKKGYLDFDGFRRFRFFIPRDAIDVLSNFYDKVEGD